MYEVRLLIFKALSGRRSYTSTCFGLIYFMDNSWFKIYRKIIDWEWFSDANTFKAFIYLIAVANFKPKKWKGIDLRPGDVVTGRSQLALALNLTEQQVRTILNRLKSTNEITIKTSPQGTIIHIVRYEEYQISTNETTNNQPTNNQQITNNQPLYKNDRKKERKNDINNSYSAHDFKNDLLNLGIDEKLAEDVIQHLRKCKGLFTERSFAGLKKQLTLFAEGEKNNFAAALTFLVEQTSWQTFNYEYYKNKTNGNKKTEQKHVAVVRDYGQISGALQF